jgi:ABC-type iron transport system FetAB ATPase subunit
MPRLELRALQSPHAGPFTLAIEPGATLAITGPSGAGKSLLLRMVADLDPNDGEALLDGHPRQNFTAPEWRRRVTYTAAEPGWWHDTVGEHFATIPTADAEALDLRPGIFAEQVRLCSTGERQRLALLRALANTPAVLLLDEPTAALDAANVARVEALLQTHLARGMTLLLVTHDPAQATRLTAQNGQHRHLEHGKLL